MNSSPCPLARPLSLLILLSLGLYAQRTRGQAPTGSEVTATSTPTARIITSGTPVVSVLDFGATGNGVSDDTAAINSAMAACVSKAAPHNGCVLYFPAGVYLTTGLSLRSFVNIKGDGWGTSVIQLKPHTASDVLTVPAAAFNFSVYGITLDGNSASGGSGNCFSTASTPTGPAAWNTQNKHTAPVNAQKWGHVEEVMFSNCSADGIHVNAFNYMLMFDNFYAFNNGVYGVFTQGTNSGYTNFQIERNGTAGIHVAGSNNRFTSGEVIWNGSRNNTEAAVYVSGGRNIITAVETEDNYTNGFFDTGSDDVFVGCISDSDGYARGNTNASSHLASGFVLSGVGGTFIGDKVSSYRGLLPDHSFATELPYRIDNPNQARIDISYDSTNKPPPSASFEVIATDGPAVGHIACIKSAGPPLVIGSCSTAVDSKGSCACK